MISNLPPELLDSIIGLTPTKTQLDLRSVSRLFDSIATRRGYQTIHLKTWAQTLLCFKTLSSNLSITRAVRSVLIRPGPQHRRPVLLAAAYEVISKALENVSPHIVDLNFLGFELEGFPFPDHCPRLRNFSTSQAMSANVASFISRHPNIDTLMLPDIISGFTPPTICLPSMTFLTCLSNVAVSLMPGSRVSQLGIMWDPLMAQGDLEAFFGSLEKASVPLLGFSSYHWTPRADVFPLIPKYMPHLKQICFSCFHPLGIDEEIWDNGMNDILPNLKNLMSIEVQWDALPDLTPGQLDKEFAVLTRWGHLCPSLEICYLPSRISWRRLKCADSAWIPDPGTDRLIAIKCTVWLRRLLISDLASEFLNALRYMTTKHQAGELVEFSSQICDTWRFKCQDIAQYRGLRAFGAQESIY
ncbi:hypothetical protein BDZ94DRAFT_1276205 [Collybia nuda]|uniref:F-box domain-containing protein n=1 Tax=Collybia nuda TaxID=64659 RepID=A0A9P6CCM2_9AGAR|nr:hypothetical protein BDZ94DRAFT_1276205 [Collybia nuda]